MNIIEAVKSNNIEKVIELINQGIDINMVNEYGQNPLSEACRLGSFSIVKLLIEKGAIVNPLDNNANIPLSEACKLGSFSIVELLLANGADINKTDHFGSTPLIAAVQYGNSQIVSYLINNGANPTHRDGQGRYVSSFAILSGNNEILSILADYYPSIWSNNVKPSQYSINQRKELIISQTNEAILADTSIPININLSEFGCDVIDRGCSDENKVKIQDFINENPNNSIIIKIIDSVTHFPSNFLYTRENLNQALRMSTVYPCLEANNLPGISSNVITNLPLYSLATIINVKILVKKDMLDTLLQNPGDLFIVVNKHVYSYPSIASHEVIFNQGDLMGALHCNRGAEVEKLYNIKRVNIPVISGGYYNKLQKYRLKPKLLLQSSFLM